MLQLAWLAAYAEKCGAWKPAIKAARFLLAQARYDQAVAKEVLDANDLEVKKRALQQLIGKFPDALRPLGDKLELPRPKPDNIDEWVKADEMVGPAG